MKKEILLPRKTCFLWQLRIGLVALVVSSILFWLCAATVWMLIPAGIFSAAVAVFTFWYLPLFFKSYRITAEKGAFTVKKGVFFETTYIMPYPRLIYVSTYSSPIARRFKLCGAVMRAARGIIIIPEMNTEDVGKISELAAGESHE